MSIHITEQGWRDLMASHRQKANELVERALHDVVDEATIRLRQNPNTWRVPYDSGMQP